MSSSKEIILTNPEDWELWISRVRTISDEDLWPYIDPNTEDLPDNAAPLLERPTEPSITAINSQATEYLQLTPAQQRSYERARGFYEVALEKYKKQRKHIREIRTHINGTVSEQKRLLLDPELSTLKWLTMLKENTKPSNSYMKKKVHNQYNEALKGIKPAKVNQWVDRWEHAMTLIIKYNMPQMNEGLWLIDLAEAVRPLSESLYTKYYTQAEDDKESVVSEYRKVARHLRELLGNTRKAPSGTARGSAFATEFAGEPEEATAPTDATKEGQNDSTGQNRKRAGTNSIQKEKTTKKTKRPKCPACDLKGHSLKDCWYLFEDKRPEDFKYSEERMQEIQKRVDEDKTLAAKIEKLKLTEGDQA